MTRDELIEEIENVTNIKCSWNRRFKTEDDYIILERESSDNKYADNRVHKHGFVYVATVGVKEKMNNTKLDNLFIERYNATIIASSYDNTEMRDITVFRFTIY